MARITYEQPKFCHECGQKLIDRETEGYHVQTGRRLRILECVEGPKALGHDKWYEDSTDTTWSR